MIIRDDIEKPLKATEASPPPIPRDERFTAYEIQTAVVAIAGLERLYEQLWKRGGQHDDRLMMAIQNVKAMFRSIYNWDPVKNNWVLVSGSSKAPRIITPDKPPESARVVTEEQLDKLGRLVDTIDNLVHAGAIPMPDKLRATALTEALPGLHSELKTLYIEIAGEDPWADIVEERPPYGR